MVKGTLSAAGAATSSSAGGGVSDVPPPQAVNRNGMAMNSPAQRVCFVVMNMCVGLVNGQKGMKNDW